MYFFSAISKYNNFKIVKTLSIATCLLLPINLIAQTMYISDHLKTYTRKGASEKFRINGAAFSGDKVEVLDTDGRYSLIRNAKGSKGWIPTNELMPNPPAINENPKLQAKIEELTQQLNNIDQSWQSKTAEIERRAKSAETQSATLIEQNTKLSRALNNAKINNQEIQAMLDAERNGIIFRYFIYGGSVLFIGLLFGLIIPLIIPRRRKNSW